MSPFIFKLFPYILLIILKWMNTDSELCTTRETVNLKRYFKTCMTVHEFIHMNLTLFPLEINLYPVPPCPLILRLQPYKLNETNLLLLHTYSIITLRQGKKTIKLLTNGKAWKTLCLGPIKSENWILQCHNILTPTSGIPQFISPIHIPKHLSISTPQQ